MSTAVVAEENIILKQFKTFERIVNQKQSQLFKAFVLTQKSNVIILLFLVIWIYKQENSALEMINLSLF